MPISIDNVRDALKQVKYPGYNRDIVAFGLVKDVEVEGGRVRVFLQLSTNDSQIPPRIKEGVESAVSQLPGVTEVEVHLQVQPAPTGATRSLSEVQVQLPGVKHIIAVASGKGGVGKSTVAANLACALEQTGSLVGLCDCDIYGPSIALMFGTNEAPTATDDERILPISRYNLKLMSMGFFMGDKSAAILRGPMVSRYTQQFLKQVAWDQLDYLVLDLPPGTGDIQLTIVQTVALSGSVIVTTPQEVALIDARKAVQMFEAVNVPILGIIENMSYFLCPSDGKRYDIFGAGGGINEAKRLGVPLLGQIPIWMEIREAGDRGVPVVAGDPKSPQAQIFREMAVQIRTKLS